MRATEEFGHALDPVDGDARLDRRPKHADLIALLRRAAAGERRVDLARQQDHRQRRAKGLGRAADEVCRARTEGGVRDGGPVGDTGVAVGREGAVLLVADQNMPDLVLVRQRVVVGQHLEAAHSERQIDLMQLQHLHDGVATPHNAHNDIPYFCAFRRF